MTGPTEIPLRQIRATFDAHTVRVYQAYSPAIAGPALAAQRFVPPFKRERMTWIKPSFLWMAYRCGWARKPGQEQVLALTLTRSGFEQALAASCLSHFDVERFPGLYPTHADWERRRDATSIRLQWDPERDLHLAPLAHRSLQLGIGGPAVGAFVDDWITAVDDVTPLMAEVEAAVGAGALDVATALLPEQRPYPLTPELAATVGATG